jgi:predicted Zn-dependent protease
MMSETSSGYADAISTNVTDINAEAVADEAIKKALTSQNPVALEPGEYETILEEYAVSDILDYLADLGFSALAVQEGRSFVKLGERLVGENITIWDNGHDPTGLPMPFDFEGVPKQRLNLIEAGIAKAIAYDSYTAGREGKTSTGHALPAPNTFGPLPMNMFMHAGEATKEDMIKSTRRGILVTRFWYTRPIHPLRCIITGTTRDGTFFISDGEIIHPIKNLRFTESYLKTLSNTISIARATKLESNGFGANRVPAIKVAKFMFTGVTEY